MNLCCRIGAIVLTWTMGVATVGSSRAPIATSTSEPSHS